MASTCFTPVRARVLRSTRLDSCGVPVVGTRSTIVTNGFISVKGSSHVLNGQDFSVDNAKGDLCVNEKDADQLRWVNLETILCSVDPDLVEMAGGLRLITSTSSTPASGSSIGYAENEDRADQHFAYELWQPIAGGLCAGGTQLFVYTVFPDITNGQVGDLSFENAAATFTLRGETRAAGTAWGNGPYEAGLMPVLEGEHWAQYLTTVVPPTAACGAVSLAA
jgi:hypothetical protein